MRGPPLRETVDRLMSDTPPHILVNSRGKDERQLSEAPGERSKSGRDGNAVDA